MGKVLNSFGNGSPGTISRSVDDIVISVRNSTASPQEYDSFLGFAVRIADKTPDTYPQDQSGALQAGAWKPGDVMEVLVRGGIVIPLAAIGQIGGKIYIRKVDGELTNSAGQSGTTVLLENVHIRKPGSAGGTYTEVVVNSRNVL